MKIVQIINQLSGGGAERLVLQLHERYQNAGHESYIISLLDSDTAFSDPRIIGLGFSSPWNPKIFFKLRSTLHDLENTGVINIIHTHLTQSQLWGGLIKRFCCRKAHLITTEHDTWNNRRGRWVGRLFDSILYQPYDHIICISEGVKTALNQWLTNSISQTVVIYNGIDLQQFTASKKTTEEEVTIISVGRLLPKKNFETSILACAKLKEYRFQYNIYGEGQSFAELNSLIEANGLQDHVHLCGFSDEIPEKMASSAIFLLTSRWEGFGLVVAEAMASGLACIVSNIDGVSEVAGEDGKTALLVDPESAESIANSLKQLLDDSSLREKIAQAGYERSKLFCIDRMANEYTELYSQK